MSNFLERDLEPAITAVAPPAAVVLVGLRACGKESLVRHILKKLDEPCVFYACNTPADLDRLWFENREEVEAFLLQAPIIVIEDAHLAPDIRLTLSHLVNVNETLEKPSRIFVTASTSLALAKGVRTPAEKLIVEQQLWPFSTAELARNRSKDFVKANLSNLLVYGSLPPIVEDFEHAADFLVDYVDYRMFRDLYNLLVIRNRKGLKSLLDLLARRIGTEVDDGELSRESGLCLETVRRYLQLLELVYVIKIVPTYSQGLRRPPIERKKIYFTDLGIRNALIRDFSPFAERADAAGLWENFVVMERVKLHDTLRDAKKLYVIRPQWSDPHESDFIELEGEDAVAFACRLTREKAEKHPKTLTAYPEIPIRVFTPETYPDDVEG